MRARFSSLSRRRNIYYPVHGPAVEESSRVGAGKSSRAANCPPSYPPYTLPHTPKRNYPLCMLPRALLYSIFYLSSFLSFSLSPSPSLSLFLFPLLRSFNPLTAELLLPLSRATSFPATRTFATALDRRYRLESFRLPTPYKRSCCPFITTTATTTRETIHLYSRDLAPSLVYIVPSALGRVFRNETERFSTSLLSTTSLWI